MLIFQKVYDIVVLSEAITMFKDRVKELRKNNGYSMDTLADMYNLRFDGKMNKSTISRYENGLQEPMYTVVKNLASLFDVSTDYLLCNEKPASKEDGLKDTELALIELYRSLDDRARSTLLEHAEFLKHRQTE